MICVSIGRGRHKQMIAEHRHLVEQGAELVELPTEFSIISTYPNPFNSSTTIKYGLPWSGNVSLRIYNPLGQQVGTVFEGYQYPGFHTATLAANNLPSGLYFIRLQHTPLIRGGARGDSVTRKLILTR